MTLWSVVVTHLMTVEPGARRRVRAGAVVVRSIVESVAALIVSCLRRCSRSRVWSSMSCSRLRELLSRPLWPLARSSSMCRSYSARGTTLTLNSIWEW